MTAELALPKYRKYYCLNSYGVKILIRYKDAFNQFIKVHYEFTQVSNKKSMAKKMKINLGCGSKILSGYTNVDKFNAYNVDLVHDLECFPYPFDDNEATEIIMHHVLEHIGQKTDTFNQIIKELYRVCAPGGIIDIKVPHPRHDDFLSDPTHVRPIMPLGLALYSKSMNAEWVKKGASNSPLAEIHNVDFEMVHINYVIEEKYMIKMQKGEISKIELDEMVATRFNIVKQIDIKWKAIK